MNLLLVINLPETDIGPIINEVSLKKLLDHKARMKKENKVMVEVANKVPDQGYFFNPTAIQIDAIGEIDIDLGLFFTSLFGF